MSPAYAAAEPYTPASFRSFGGGLNLRDHPDVLEEHQAVDLLNVTFTERGSVKQRDGYAKFSAAELTNRPDSIFPYYTAGGTKQLLVGNGNRIDVLNTSGTSIYNVTSPTASPHYFVRIGTSAAEYVYISNGTDQVRRYDGTSITAPAGLSGRTGMFVGLQTPDNRLVVARSSTNTSRVWFSEPGTPETHASNDWVELTPGDGEAITGIAAFANEVYVFKETGFAVFYGNSIDPETGETVFNYRTVKGVGCVAPRTLAVGADGVYFLSRDGIYRTQGGAASLVSDIVQPIFVTQTDNLYFHSKPLNHAALSSCVMRWWNDRLYFAYPSTPSTTNNRMLVWDPKGWWTLYDIPAGCMTTFRIGDEQELVFGYASGTKYLGRHKGKADSYRADDLNTDGTGGTAITARWRSGWFDYGSTVEKTIRESKAWGAGSVTMRVYRDFLGYPDLQVPVLLSSASDLWGDGTDVTDTWGDGTTTDLWGPTGTITPTPIRKAIKGTFFSTEFRNDELDKSFAMHRFTHHLRESRIPSVIHT